MTLNNYFGEKEKKASLNESNLNDSDILINKAITNLNLDLTNKNYSFTIKYSGRFKDFGANVRYLGNNVVINLSKSWLEYGEEVRIGVIQELLCRMFKIKTKTLYMDMYNDFIKNIGKFKTGVIHDNDLKESFDRVNEKYFNGLMSMPSLKFGRKSVRQFGKYEFNSDTIIISSILKNNDLDVLDFIMYHELLHKSEKYTRSGNTVRYHTSEFRRREKLFNDFNLVNEKIKKIARSNSSNQKKIATKRGIMSQFNKYF